MHLFIQLLRSCGLHTWVVPIGEPLWVLRCNPPGRRWWPSHHGDLLLLVFYGSRGGVRVQVRFQRGSLNLCVADRGAVELPFRPARAASTATLLDAVGHSRTIRLAGRVAARAGFG